MSPGTIASPFRFLGSIHPLVYLCLYVFSIPGFGFVYRYLTPHEFYAPYSKMEPAAQSDGYRIARDINKSIKKSMDRQASLKSDWLIDKDSVVVTSVIAEPDGSVQFDMYTSAHLGAPPTESESGTYSYVMPPRSRVYISDPAQPGPHPDPMVLHEVSRVQDNLDSDPSLSEYENKLFFSSPEAAIRLPVVVFSPQEESRLAAFQTGNQGDAGSFSGTWPRLLYFSAMTITTVGYGDIVPLSDRSRGIAAIEAVSGWILAGLFLNAWGQRRQGGQLPRSHRLEQ